MCKRLRYIAKIRSYLRQLYSYVWSRTPDNDDRHQRLYEYTHLAVPPPPRFDAAATVVARRVEPLPQRRFLWVYENIQLAPSHWKLLVLTAVVSLTTGGVGGMLIKDGQQSLGNEPTLNSISGEAHPSASGEAQPISPDNVENTGGMIGTSPAEVAEPPQPRPRRHTRLRRAPRLQVVELTDEDSEDEDKDDRKRKKDDADDDDRDRKTETRPRRAMLYDVMRMRRP